jgi:transcriptional regulator with PAS, ATPase and Fis domain
MSHSFPGNIRELENIIEYASVVCKNSMIGMEHLPDYLHQTTKGEKHISGKKVPHDNVSWQDLERKFLIEILKKNKWNKSATAAQLGIHTTTLWRKMKRLKIESIRPGN